MTNPEQTTFVDVEVIDVASPDNAIDVTVTGNPVIEIADLGGPVGPPGPQGPGASIGGGFPPDSTGETNGIYHDVGAKMLYGPKMATPITMLGEQQLLANVWFGLETMANNIAPFEVATEFQVVQGAIDVTAIRFYRMNSDAQATTQLSVWNATTQALIHRTTVAVQLGQGWRIAPLSAAVRLAPGNYVVSYSLIDATARSAHPKDVSLAIPQVANVRFVRARYGAVPGAYPPSSTIQYPSLVDPVFSVISPWRRTEIQTLLGKGPPVEAVGYAGDTYVDANTGIQYGPKLGATVAQPPSQNLYPFDAPVGPAQDPLGFEVGLEFAVAVNGLVNGVRYYRMPTDTATTRTVKLWENGVKVAEATSTTEFGSGWRTILFASPYRVYSRSNGGGNYVVSYDVAPNMHMGTTVAKPAPAATRFLSYVINRYNKAPGTYPNLVGQNWYAADVDFTPESVWPVTPTARPAKVDFYPSGLAPYPAVSAIETFTWTKPAGAKLIHVILQGSGAGGGSGRRGAAGTVRCGGGGGGGGIRKEVFLPAHIVLDSVIVAISQATGGAPGITTDDTNGLPAKPCGGTEFRYRTPSPAQNPSAYVYSGSHGEGGTATSGGGAGGALGCSGGGAAATNGGNGQTSPTTYIYGSTFGGGAGGGVTAANVAGFGGGSYRGQLSSEYGVTAGGGVDGASGTPPPNPDFPDTIPWGPGGGGGGGAGSVAGPAGKGSAGYRGGGGGGGGGSVNGQLSGAGGDGGRGYVMVITYF